jgi:Holliday junction resolvase RusA-like endonuclease
MRRFDNMIGNAYAPEMIFNVPGKPVPQPRPKISTRGGFGRAYTPAKHPINEYRQAIAMYAKLAGCELLTGSVAISVQFIFERPKSHFNKSGLKKDAPDFVGCDVDNLLKGVLDALIGIAFIDDRQVEYVEAGKIWGDESATKIEIFCRAENELLLGKKKKATN